jgi:hypothetical protein
VVVDADALAGVPVDEVVVVPIDAAVAAGPACLATIAEPPPRHHPSATASSTTSPTPVTSGHRARAGRRAAARAARVGTTTVGAEPGMVTGRLRASVAGSAAAGHSAMAPAAAPPTMRSRSWPMARAVW